MFKVGDYVRPIQRSYWTYRVLLVDETQVQLRSKVSGQTFWRHSSGLHKVSETERMMLDLKDEV